MQHNENDVELINGFDTLHARISSDHRELFRVIAEADRREVWRNSGARDLTHWLSMRCGISGWKAKRWIAAALALETLPDLSAAFSAGELGIDKVVEIARFADFETEAGLIQWAKRVSLACVRRKADLACRMDLEDIQDAEKSRLLSWWYFDGGRRFGLEAELPAAQGAVVRKALEHLAETVPVMPGEEAEVYTDARRADALVMLCSNQIAGDPDPDRATVVVHAQLGTLLSGEHSAEIEGEGVIHAETAKRLLCNGRVQAVIEDGSGNPIKVGRLFREPPAWMLRQLRYRDKECVFPGCGSRRFTHAHHIVWWGRGGHTDLDNLLLVCGFHHKLVHEFGWSVSRAANGVVDWHQPDGSSYRSGPDPPMNDAVA